MDTIIYIGVALLLAAVLFLAFRKKHEATGLPPAEQPRALEKTRPEAREKLVEPTTPSSGPAPEVVARGEQEEAVEHAPASTRVPSSKPTPLKKTPKHSATEPKRDIAGLRKGLALSRGTEGFFGRIKGLFGKGEISPEIVERLEEVLLTSDVGVATSNTLLDRLRGGLSKGELNDEAAIWEALRSEAKQLLASAGTPGAIRLEPQKPTVVLLVGVNGAGKTTTIGKLATKLKSQGLTCVLAAGDTFRAAAVQQLVVWGNRVGCEVVRGKDGSDPGSVIFDAVKKAQETGADVVLADTAGRLHTKSNLMAEMQKIARTTQKALDGAPHEMLLVIDSTNGQNALAQAKEFKDSLALSGIVLTKLDGTAKGGVVLGIADSLKLPVRYVGLGERPDDLHEFVIDDFVEALLGKEV